MAERATVSIHTTPEMRERLEQLASVTRRSKSSLGAEALEQFLTAEERYIAGVQEGVADADAGRTMTSEVLKQRIHAAIDGVSQKPA